MSTFTEEELAAWSRVAAPPAPPPPAVRPLHTVYGGAHLFREDTAPRLGGLALQALHRHGKDAGGFARVLGLPPKLADTVWDRTERMLATAAVQDLRIDFEDGFGPRPDDEEDHHAERAGRALAAAWAADTAPRGIGLRIRAIDGATTRRALRTLDRFLGAAGSPGGRPLVVALPKVTGPAPVAVLAAALDRFEAVHGLAAGAVSIEVMAEVPGALPRMAEIAAAAGGRCVAAHLGAYDLTAACGVPAADQALDHPLCDHARAVLQLSLAGTGVAVVDGATTLLPIGPHRGSRGEALGREQLAENDRAVHEAWRQHARNVRRAWSQGVPQGWDLHPAQIPVRFGVCAALLLEGLPVVAERLKRFLDNAARATRTGAVFDDAATGQGLLNTLRTGAAAGLLTEVDLRGAGVTGEELSLSFPALVARRGPPPPGPAPGG